MSGHAPGPWKYDKDNLNVYANGMVAQVFGHIHTGEKEANARLIAAAPDLLESLKGVISLLDTGYLVRNIEDDAASARRSFFGAVDERLKSAACKAVAHKATLVRI